MTGSAGGASYPAYKCGFVERTLRDTQSQTDSKISAAASPIRHTGILGDPVSWKMYTGWALGHLALKADSGSWAYPVGHPPIISPRVRQGLVSGLVFVLRTAGSCC